MAMKVRPLARYRFREIVYADEFDVIEVGWRPAVHWAVSLPFYELLVPLASAERIGTIYGDGPA